MLKSYADAAEALAKMKKFGSFSAIVRAQELETYDMKVDDDTWDSLSTAERAAWILGLSEEPWPDDGLDFFALSTSEWAWFVDGLTRAHRARLGA